MTKKVRSLSLVFALVVGLLAFASVSSVRADGPTQVDLVASGAGTVVVAPDVPYAPVTLQVDDGSAEDAIGLTNGGSFVWLNRFTPAATEYPFTLNQIQVLFTSTAGCVVGDAMDLYVYTDADGNPGNGATPVGSITGQTVQALDTWSTYPASVVLSGPGDVLIAVVNRGCNAAGQFPAAIDTTASQGRSWVGFGTGATGNPPTIPSATFGTIDSFGFPGNWMIRGSGETAPTAVEIGQVGGSAGSTGWLFALAGVALVGLGLVAIRRR